MCSLSAHLGTWAPGHLEWQYAGREWFATTLEALDKLASNQGYEIRKAEEQ